VQEAVARERPALVDPGQVRAINEIFPYPLFARNSRKGCIQVVSRWSAEGWLHAYSERRHQVESSTPNSGVLSGRPSLAE
jgi:hypothetical protein